MVVHACACEVAHHLSCGPTVIQNSSKAPHPEMFLSHLSSKFAVQMLSHFEFSARTSHGALTLIFSSLLVPGCD